MVLEEILLSYDTSFHLSSFEMVKSTQLIPDTRSLDEKIRELSELSRQLTSKENYEEKEDLLALPFERFFHEHFSLAFSVSHLPQKERYLLKALIAAGQGELLENILSFEEFCRDLEPVEIFYREMGGIVGYQKLALELLRDHNRVEKEVLYFPPTGYDISQDTPFVRKAIQEGIETLPFLGEIYPVGGAADRLGLKEEKTGRALPAARLKFLQTNLLERLLRDLMAREYLYYKLFGRQIITPVALMTSNEKEGDEHIREILKSAHHFGRGEENFFLFRQPLVPTFTSEGSWCLQNESRLKLKPGGHGVIWKLAKQEGVFDWFKERGRKKALIRQINNPIAGVDYALLAFTGLGFLENRPFGFASCQRRLKSKEGMNVIRERRGETSSQVVLTNIEYCEFAHHGIEDAPLHDGENYSRFPSNTNILFADLEAVREKVESNPLPGMILNFKEGEHWVAGGLISEPIARIETTMQNIADSFVTTLDVFDSNCAQNTLQSFLTYNKRRKTISATKKEYQPGGPLLETPLGCLYDFVENSRELLSEFCNVELPAKLTSEQFIEQGPSFLFHYHPALGPLFSLIGQKIQRGKIVSGSEIQLEITNLKLEDFTISGYFNVLTDAVMGHFDEDNRLRFSERAGSAIMKNIRVVNDPSKNESFTVLIEENGQFIAEGVSFLGTHFIKIPKNTLVRATQKESSISLTYEEKKECSFHSYHLDNEEKIKLHS